MGWNSPQRAKCLYSLSIFHGGERAGRVAYWPPRRALGRRGKGGQGGLLAAPRAALWRPLAASGGQRSSVPERSGTMERFNVLERSGTMERFNVLERSGTMERAGSRGSQPVGNYGTTARWEMVPVVPARPGTTELPLEDGSRGSRPIGNYGTTVRSSRQRPARPAARPCWRG